MDPLSITLVVITLATALKDIIETATAIQDAFSKRPQNYKNAQRLAKSMLGTLEDLQEIYEEKKAIIDGKKHLKRSIDNLLEEMKSVHEQCMHLIPPVSEKKRDKFRIAFYSFWDRRKIERLISDLNEHVNTCLSKFSALSMVRTETQVVEIHETIALSNARTEAHAIEMHEILRTVLRGGHAYGHNNIEHESASKAQLFAFTGSASLPMTWIPDTIPTHVLSKAYLRRELGRIDIPLLSSKTRRWLHDNPVCINVPASTWSLHTSPVSDTVVHQDAIVLVIRIQSLLRNDPNNSWLQSIDLALTNLTSKLIELHMFEDTLSINSQLVEFWRDIAKHSSRSSSVHLQHVEALTRLAFNFSHVGPGNACEKCVTTKVAATFVFSRLLTFLRFDCFDLIRQK